MWLQLVSLFECLICTTTYIAYSPYLTPNCRTVAAPCCTFIFFTHTKYAAPVVYNISPTVSIDIMLALAPDRCWGWGCCCSSALCTLSISLSECTIDSPL